MYAAGKRRAITHRPGPKCAKPRAEISYGTFGETAAVTARPSHDLPVAAAQIFSTGRTRNRNSYNLVSINRHAALSFVTAGGCSASARQRPATKGVPWR